MNKNNDTTWYIVTVIAGVGLGIIASFVLASSSTITTTTTNITTQILSKFYPLTGISIYNNTSFYTNTSPTGCISYAVVTNNEYNVTSQSYTNETIKITNATEVKTLYNTISGMPYGTNQWELFMTINGTNNYVIILQNQTLLCK